MSHISTFGTFVDTQIAGDSFKMCLRYQICPSNEFQTLAVHVFKTQIWQVKHLPNFLPIF